MKLQERKDQIVNLQRFLDNYNLWLSSVREHDIVSVKTVGIGPEYDYRTSGIVRKIGRNKMAVEIRMPHGLRALCEFWLVRTLSQGYPRQGEMFVEPSPTSVGELTRRLTTKAVMRPINQREFELDPVTGEMRTEG